VAHVKLETFPKLSPQFASMQIKPSPDYLLIDCHGTCLSFSRGYILRGVIVSYFPLYFLKILFIYLRDREKAEAGVGVGAEGQADSLLSAEPTRGSIPGPQDYDDLS